MLVLHTDVPEETLGEFLACANANHGKLNCGATGFGGSAGGLTMKAMSWARHGCPAPDEMRSRK